MLANPGHLSCILADANATLNANATANATVNGTTMGADANATTDSVSAVLWGGIASKYMFCTAQNPWSN